MSELTKEEIAAVLPVLAERAKAVVQRRQSFNIEATPEEVANEYRKGVAVLKGPATPFLANIYEIPIDEAIEHAQQILDGLHQRKVLLETPVSWEE